MPVFYTLHELFSVFSINETDGKTEHGKRNSKLFLFGTFIWTAIFVLLMNFKMGYFGNKPGEWFDSIFYGTIVLMIADIMTMAYTYKSYFGRNILYEVGDNDLKFDYNENDERYVKNENKEIIHNAKIEMTKDIVNNTIRDTQMRNHARKILRQEKVEEEKVEEKLNEPKDKID